MKARIELTNFQEEKHPESEAFAAAKDMTDLKQVSYILCTEGPNRNNDYWFKEVIDAAAPSCVNKPINIDHDRDWKMVPARLIGHNTAYEVGEVRPNKYGVKVYAVLYDYLYQFDDAYQDILVLLNDGTLRASMEVLFDEYKIVSRLGQEVTVKPGEDDALPNGYCRAFWGDSVAFFGAAFLMGQPPADPNCIVFDESANDGDEDEDDDVEDSLSFAAEDSDLLQAPVSDWEPLLAQCERLVAGGVKDQLEAVGLLVSALAAEEVSIVGSSSLPLDDSADWDGAAAKRRMWDAADGNVKRYARGFVARRGDPENKTSYIFPFADIRGGTLKAVWGGVRAAMSASHKARSAPAMSEAARKRIHSFCAGYYKKFKKEVPEFT